MAFARASCDRQPRYSVCNSVQYGCCPVQGIYIVKVLSPDDQSIFVLLAFRLVQTVPAYRNQEPTSNL
jgi:hypothetical protein